jgi:NAD(P)-dependent dehydrogenase (short-subunit alcohol dehydrogenase family)
MPEYAIYPSLKDKPVLVTGGASGIGGATVEAFAAQGAKVAFLDMDETASTAMTKATGAPHVVCDLRDIPAMQAAIEKLTAQHGPFEALVNNAARDDRHDWQDVSIDYWDERMNTNLRHMYFAIQAVAPGMARAGGGSIINMGSSSWWETCTDMSVYATAKAAVHGLTRSMARELGNDRIRVNALVPGWVMTERQRTLWATPEALEGRLARQCLPDLIDPVYIANMVMFLAADDSAMCTASNFMADGGAI